MLNGVLSLEVIIMPVQAMARKMRAEAKIVVSAAVNTDLNIGEYL
jgi:hypothetical protein